MTTLLHLGSKFRTRGVTPPVSHMSYGVHAKNFTYIHAARIHARSRRFAPPATCHVPEQNPHTSCILRRLPDMHLTGWKSSQTVNDPAMSGEANRSIYAGWRTKPWRTFILHVTWTNLWYSSSRKFGFQTTLRLQYVLHVSREGGIKMKNMNSNNQSPNTSYSWGNYEE